MPLGSADIKNCTALQTLILACCEKLRSLPEGEFCSGIGLVRCPNASGSMPKIELRGTDCPYCRYGGVYRAGEAQFVSLREAAVPPRRSIAPLVISLGICIPMASHSPALNRTESPCAGRVQASRCSNLAGARSTGERVLLPNDGRCFCGHRKVSAASHAQPQRRCA